MIPGEPPITSPALEANVGDYSCRSNCLPHHVVYLPLIVVCASESVKLVEGAQTNKILLRRYSLLRGAASWILGMPPCPPLDGQSAERVGRRTRNPSRFRIHRRTRGDEGRCLCIYHVVRCITMVSRARTEERRERIRTRCASETLVLNP